jgi:hypothetical protein
MHNNNTCDMYKSSLRHIHDPVLSSLKMKGIRFFFYSTLCHGDSDRSGKAGKEAPYDWG